MGVAFAAGLSVSPQLERAIEEVCDAGIVGADLACVFVSSAYGADVPKVAAGIQRRLGPRALVGCAAQGVIGGAREVEEGPALALWTAVLPGAEVLTFHARARQEGERYAFTGLPRVDPDDTLLLMPDPFSVPLVELIAGFPAGVVLLGGVASGAPWAHGNTLFVDKETHSEGIAGALLRGASVHPVVSQGCRPVGRPFVVTKVEDNFLLGLAGRSAVERVNEVFSSLGEEDRALVRQGLHVGCAIDEYKERHGTGDFLVRNVVGVDAGRGALAVSDHFRVGQTVQFHVRDGQSAQEELQRLLRAAAGDAQAKGALLFACNGRGTHMYGRPDGDATTLQEVFGGLAVAGFFAGGEIGPVGGANHLHGFTASLALFCE